ncbi:unnamed protein product (macronuclear) [Paramecium tetraurelia]|uniref:G-protein coupled receptors family 2 profile 2 domain-containing protein n=1 Tax=Paramecium tetraurelia TaxID=5888 RepID=A0E132_PARTE|nr:uncharacterized protein GSPATT00022168001 [Paramecium tetraurelia]CAK88999.1 unnamed protein product [Paramecium tetraurelia]|eukprot:XP_001456396.1 hypothetical protein (macronuclear) [Paramecium tetraurelia strain d4-2]
MHDLILPIVTIFLSVLSIISCGFVIYIYGTFRELRNDQFTIILQIIVFNLIFDLILFGDSFGYLFLRNSTFQMSDKPVLCQSQSFFSVYSVLSSALWTSILIHSLYHSIKEREANQYMQSYYPGLGYGIPLLISIIPIIIDAYGQYNPMPQTNCFFDVNNVNVELYTMIFYNIPIWIMFLYNLIVIILAIRINKNFTQSLYSIYIYQGILAVCWIIPSIVNLFGFTSLVWKTIDFGLGGLIGFLNSFWYSYTSLADRLSFENGQLVQRIKETTAEQELAKI